MFLIALFFIAVPATASAALTFKLAVDFEAGTVPYSVAIDDLNNDGRTDLVTANLSRGNVSVLVNAPTADANPASLTVGSPTPVTRGTTSDPQTATVTKNGSAPLRVRGFAVSGTNPVDFFTVNFQCGELVQEGSSCQVDVVFSPRAEGSRSATLSALTNAASDPTVSLSGTAGPPATGDLGLIEPKSNLAGLGIFRARKATVVKVPQNRKLKIAEVGCEAGTCTVNKIKVRSTIRGKVYSAKGRVSSTKLKKGEQAVVELTMGSRLYRKPRRGRKSGAVTAAVTAKSTNGDRITNSIRTGLRR